MSVTLEIMGGALAVVSFVGNRIMQRRSVRALPPPSRPAPIPAHRASLNFVAVPLRPAGADSRLVEVVGESYHVDELVAITGRIEMEGLEGRTRYRAVLVPEFDNDFDANAVKVQIQYPDDGAGGLDVGSLSRKDAAAYRRVLEEMFDAQILGHCSAFIFARPGTPNLGVWLDLARPARCRPADWRQLAEALNE